MEKKSMKGYLYLMPALIIILLFTAYPLVRAFLMSFYEDYNMISGEYSRIGLGNYKDLFGDKDFTKALRNTSIYVVFVVPCSIALSLLIAVLLNSNIKFQGLFQTIFFLPYVTSVIAIGLVWSWIFNSNYGLLNYILSWFGIAKVQWLNKPKYALPSLIIFSVWKSMAFDILIFLAGLQSISPTIYESCQIDGATSWETFWKITFPMISPMILVNAVYTVIDSFTTDSNTIMKFISNEYLQPDGKGTSTAMAWMYFLIVIAMVGIIAAICSAFVFYQRRND